MRLFVDENLQVPTVRFLRELGYDAVGVDDEHLVSQDDDCIFAHARKTERVLVTYDMANRPVVAAWAAPNALVGYTRYPAGQVSNLTFAAGIVAHTLDVGDRLLQLDGPQGTFAQRPRHAATLRRAQGRRVSRPLQRRRAPKARYARRSPFDRLRASR